MLEKLESLGRFGMKLTLGRISRLMQLLDHPERRLRAIHVAGTNGKGSAVAMLDSILRAAGLRTGCYTSPHLVEFRERVAVGGRPVEPDLLTEAFARVWPLVERIKDEEAGHPTQFEVVTAMAFLILAEADLDLVLIEVGLGGRHDTTNLLDPLVSVITPVALDHLDRLGPDLSAIAGEKAGIIKRGRPVVSAPQEPEALAVIEATAAALGAPLILVGRVFRFELVRAGEDGTFCRLRGRHDYGTVRVNLLGAHQAVNAATAVAAVEVLAGLGISVRKEEIALGLGTVRWPGRLELISRDPDVVLDGAHNPHGMAALARSLPEVFRRREADFLLGILDNRPIEEMAALIAPLARRVIVTTVPGGTAPPAPLERLAAAFAGSGAIIESIMDPAKAFAHAKHTLPAGGLLCVCGSLYLVGLLRGLCLEGDRRPCRGPID